jgi:hypothetical protein
MYNAHMTLKDDVFAALERKGIPTACPICGQEDWDVRERLVFLPGLRDGNPEYEDVGGGIVSPVGPRVVVMTCNSCAGIRLHDSAALLS